MKPIIYIYLALSSAFSLQLFLEIQQNDGNASIDDTELYSESTHSIYDEISTEFSHPNNDPYLKNIKQNSRETFMKDVLIPLSPQDDDDITSYYPYQYDQILRVRSYLNSTNPENEVHITYQSIDDVDDLQYLWITDSEVEQKLEQNVQKNEERAKKDDGVNQTLNEEE